MLQDLPAERAWLAGVVKYGASAWIDSNELVNDNCFSDHINQCVYTSLEHIFNANPNAVIDLASILSAAQEVGLKELSEPTNVKYIKALANFGVEEENVREFAKKVRKLSEFRSLLAEVDDSANRIKNLSGNETVTEAVSIIEKPIFDFTNKLIGGNQQVEQIAQGIDEYYEYLRERQGELEGVKIGYPTYEKVVGGLRVGVHIIGARKKTGKSYFALNAATWASYKEKVPVLYLDTELHRNQGQWDRFLARFCNQEVTVDDIKYGRFFGDERQEKVVLRAKAIMKKLPLDYINITGRSIDEIISIMRRWLIQKVGYNNKGELNKCLIVYDYLKPPADMKSLKDIKEHQEMGSRLDGLHGFTAQYNIPILTFVQLNRDHDVAISDRIGWFCTSYCDFATKSPEEIADDGPTNGNRKLVPKDLRFGEGLDPGDFINFGFNGKYSLLKELKTRNQVEADKQTSKVSEDEADGDSV